jgi:purine-cytosine permease-like protein
VIRTASRTARDGWLTICVWLFAYPPNGPNLTMITHIACLVVGVTIGFLVAAIFAATSDERP